MTNKRVRKRGKIVCERSQFFTYFYERKRYSERAKTSQVEWKCQLRLRNQPFAKRFPEEGSSLVALRDQLGHNSIETSSLYTAILRRMDSNGSPAGEMNGKDIESRKADNASDSLLRRHRKQEHSPFWSGAFFNGTD
ncbi:hypothetical protein B0X71_19265 (plasmid) [Planococcus lenghuensis]|uniref:Uncharacterized protein n=1 Tax=Planococcus lenghuensis TaxID=2213202 RepID=A0A1Q2L4G6_9BACL|nr:hypothetical protein B0X71_19265 [Planococcus lenghuensis]